jgi:hypothetical protein
MPEGAGGKEVGRISIRVVPDLDGFREKLRAELEGIEDVKVKVTADTTGFREKIKAETKDLGDAKVKVTPDVKKSEFAAALAETRAAARAAGVKLDIEFKDREAEAKLASTIAKLKAEAAASHIKLRVDVDRGVGGAGGLLGGASSSFGSGASKLALLGDQTFWVAGAVIALLAPALALLATSLAALPALIAAVALPVGAVALGIGGFKKALENVGLMGEDKKGKAKAGEELKKLQQSVSDEFERGLTPVFRELVGLLPMLRDGFTGIARGIVADIQGLSDVFTKGEGPAQLKNIMGNVGEMLNQMAPAFHSFGSAIMGLASRVSDHLPGLARFFADWGDKFSNWVNKISGDGTLDKAVSGLKPALDSVMNFFAQMMDSGLKLMADPAMVQNIKTVLDGITNFIVQSLPTLNQVFSTLADLINSLGLGGPTKPLEPAPPGGKPGGPTSAEPAAPGSGGAFQWIGPDKHQEFPDTSKMGFLDKLETGITSGTAFRGIDSFMGKLKEKIGNSFKEAFNFPTTVLATLTDQARGVVERVSAVFQELPNRLGSIWSGIEQRAQGVWSGIVSAAQGAWNTLVSNVQTALGRVRDEFGKLPEMITGPLRGLAGTLKGIGDQIISGLAEGIRGGVHKVEAAVKELAGLIPQWAKDMLGIKSPSTVMEDVGQNTVEGLKNGLDAGAASVVDRAKAIAQQVQEAMAGGFAPSGGGARGGPAQAAIDQANSMVGEAYVSGISDCSGAVSQVYSAMAGKKTHFTTMADFAALGFKPGFKKGALNIGVTPLPGQSGHMAATLPDGRNFESGGTDSKVKVGSGAAGALDKQFSQHWYYDAGGAAGVSAGGQDVTGMEGEIKQSLSELDVERDKLQAQRDAIPHGKEHKAERDSLSEQLRQIKMARDALVTERDELKLGASRVGAGDAKGGKGSVTDSMTEAAQMITKGLASIIDMSKGFVMSNVQQLESDLGIGGKGAIPTLANIGMDWATHEMSNMINADFGLGDKNKPMKKDSGDTHIHVNSVDEALTAKQTIENRKALQWKDR